MSETETKQEITRIQALPGDGDRYYLYTHPQAANDAPFSEATSPDVVMVSSQLGNCEIGDYLIFDGRNWYAEDAQQVGAVRRNRPGWVILPGIAPFIVDLSS